MLFAVASVYLVSCAIEASPIIRTADHNHITTYSVIYGLISAYLTVYAIMRLSKAPDIMALWVVSCHTGAVFFARNSRCSHIHAYYTGYGYPPSP